METRSEAEPSQKLARAREREAATREILQVISVSRDEEGPVFEAILRNAARLCAATQADLDLVDDEGLTLREVAVWGEGKRAIGSDYWVWPMDSDFMIVEAVRSAQVVHVGDLRDTDKYRQGNPMTLAAVDDEGMRTLLIVPLVSGGGGIGCITLFRQEVRPFTDDEIALVETFAAQAVIAIENVRQFREVQTRLEREAASREILQVISASRTDPAPVFDVILRHAAHLSGAPLANLCLMNDARSHWQLVAHFGDGLRHLTAGKSVTPLSSGLVPAVAMRTAEVVQIEDLRDTDLYRQGDPGRVAMVEVEGMRTILCVPLLAEAGAIGCITLFRREVKGFTRDEITLVETFAAQAVIAIENVQQFREVQERLEREIVTGEVLDVISRSRDDDVPVFDSILKNAVRLCGADRARLMLITEDGDGLRAAGQWGEANPALSDGAVIEMIPEMLPVRCIAERRSINVKDGRETEGYKKGVPQVVANIDEMGARSVLSVPLVQDDVAIGCIVLTSREIAAYDDNDVTLVETFAAQAVIAIENVRQFKALEALNAELGDRVEAQVGEIERMGKLKRFLPAAVAETVISQGSEAMLSTHRVLLGVLFCDIRGFTAFCEVAEPEETIEVLQTYHQEMGKLISDYGAGVDHRSGDGIMVLFNDPLPCEDPAGDAVRLAVAMRARMAELSAAWKRLGHRLGFGVGVSLGYATVGMVGYEGRYDYTASGTAVNLAARLCDQAKDGEILLSPRAAIAVEEQFASASVGDVMLKGMREPVEVFRLGEEGGGKTTSQ